MLLESRLSFSSHWARWDMGHCLLLSGVPLRWGSLRCKSKFWARNFKFWARDVHPTISQAQVPLRRGSLRYGANRHSGREISNSGPEMCTPIFLRPKSKPAGREKPIRVAPIRVVTKYPILASSQELRTPRSATGPRGGGPTRNFHTKLLNKKKPPARNSEPC